MMSAVVTYEATVNLFLDFKRISKMALQSICGNTIVLG
jgi:hypothetical protein